MENYKVLHIKVTYRTIAIIDRGYYYFLCFFDCRLFMVAWQYSFETRWLQNKSVYN